MKSLTTLTALLAAAASPATIRASPLGAANLPRAFDPIGTDAPFATTTVPQGGAPGTTTSVEIPAQTSAEIPAQTSIAVALRQSVPVQGTTSGNQGEIIPFDSPFPPRARRGAAPGQA